MWSYVSHHSSGVSLSGTHRIKVMMEKGEKCECFFLEYQVNPPSDEVIQNHAQVLIDEKNLIESEEALNG